MVTRLKCSELEENEEEEDESSNLEYDWGDVHLLDVLIDTEETEDNKDERFCLAMLILIEVLVIPRYARYRFPRKVLKRAQNLQSLMNYPWGRDSYMILLNSVKKTIPSRLSKPRYDLHGFPISLNLWMLESVPQLQSAFSSLNTVEPPTAFYVNPGANQIMTIEGYRNLKVICVLPFIQGDSEDTVFLEDKPDEDFDTLVDIVTKGYK
ncbi:hypothetical protein EUTSA_v10024057mg, partial [Eutrema salsugineum]